MEKLIELLNEYQYGMFVYEDDLLLLRIGSNFKVGGETFVISKKFGFIKWLVENEKIDFKKLENLNKFNDILYLRTAYYGLLMLLSIQDEPIEFLVSILK